MILKCSQSEEHNQANFTRIEEPRGRSSPLLTYWTMGSPYMECYHLFQGGKLQSSPALLKYGVKRTDSTPGTINLVVWQGLQFIYCIFPSIKCLRILILLTGIQQDRPKMGGILKSEDSLATAFLSSEKNHIQFYRVSLVVAL